jgi:hypothetical protein
MKRSHRTSVSKLQVLEALSDEISLDIFNEIAKKGGTSDNIIQILGITRKQYYARSSSLLKIGLFKREKEKFTLTSFGKLVHAAQLKIVKAGHNSWKLKVVDAISNGKIPGQEKKTVIDKLIDDSEVKRLIYFNEAHKG